MMKLYSEKAINQTFNSKKTAETTFTKAFFWG